MKKTTVVTITIHGDADLEGVLPQLAELTVDATGHAVDIAVESVKGARPFMSSRFVTHYDLVPTSLDASSRHY